MGLPKGIKQRIGKLGEELASNHLVSAGYRIIEKNYRCPFGEMDIVAAEGESVVFVEVKSRRSGRFGDPKTAIESKKQERLSKIAQYYLKEKSLCGRKARFDVVAVRILPQGHRVELIRNAFDLAYGW